MSPDEVEISFRPVTRNDFGLLQGWLENEHVRRWWKDPEEQIASIKQHLDDPTVEPLIVELKGKEFAYIQLCQLDNERENEPALKDQPDGTVGTDQFIGPKEMIGKGFGPRFMKAICERLLKEGVPRILVDPEPKNTSAIRAYEKVGFKRLNDVVTTSGPALLMILDR